MSDRHTAAYVRKFGTENPRPGVMCRECGRDWADHFNSDCPPGAKKPAASTPADSARRKGMPLFSGFLMYFPDACLAVAEHSRKNNDKHNPGQPLHWSKGKSSDHADCVARHLVDIGPNWDAVDPENGSLHAIALAWRALALLQTVLERKKEGK
jgi:hypothetical protein